MFTDWKDISYNSLLVVVNRLTKISKPAQMIDAPRSCRAYTYIQESWEEKKLAAALFMDVKGAFDHVSKAQLITRMIELGIDGDLVAWTSSFLIHRKIQLVIDGHENKEREIKTGIPQGSPVSPILFLIYISGVFDTVTEASPSVISLSFIDDLGFIASGSLVKEVV